MNVVSRDLQALFEIGSIGGLSDGQLLDHFVARREGPVFEAIVRRHGPMVWGVCRRVLRDHHDAEDAFQATFLVLARRAASIREREKLGNWLYGVAHQAAMKARSMRAKRRGREGQVSDMPEPMAVPHDRGDGLAETLDLELSRLPEKYRIPVILCELEGKTHGEVAKQLGWPIGTVSSRLARGRALLADRLTRRGVSLSIGALALLLAKEASASMPTELIGPTARAASLVAAGRGVTAAVASIEADFLMEEVMKRMLLTKLKGIGIALLTMALTGAGLLWMASRGPAIGQETANTRAATGAEASVDGDEERLQGVWTLVNLEQVGHRPTEEEKRAWKSGQFTITVRGNRLTYDADKSFMHFRLDPSQSPKLMTLEVTDGPQKGRHVPAIYRLDGDDLMICQGRLGDEEPPAGFSVEARRPGTFPTLWALRRRSSPPESDRAVEGADRSRDESDTDAYAALPGKRQSVFGGGPGEPLYIRRDDLFFVVSPIGDKFSIYDAATKRASTISLPGTKEAPLAAAPILSGGDLVSLTMEGPKIPRLYVFSLKDWKWFPHDLKEPASGILTPQLGRSVAAYSQGRFIYAFSAEAKRWSILELPEGAEAGPGVGPDFIGVEYDGHVHEFSGKTGEWKHTDLRALIDAAIDSAKEKVGQGAEPEN